MCLNKKTALGGEAETRIQQLVVLVPLTWFVLGITPSHASIPSNQNSTMTKHKLV